MSLYLTGLAQWLRAAGLAVIEYDGWQTRARGSGGYSAPAPLCVMWHHTASNPSSDGQQDASYCAVQAEDAPLANLYIQRNGTVWVLAAGATNTNGKGKSLRFSRGTVPQDSMNSYAVGIEVANNGVGEQWPKAQVDAFFAVSNVVNKNVGNRPDDIATHWEYAPDRKIDPATAPAVQGSWRPAGTNSSGSWNPDQVRQECNLRADNQPRPPEPVPDEDDDMEVVQVKVTGTNAAFLGIRSKQTTSASDGTTAPRVFVLWVEWVNGNDAQQMWRYQTYVNMGVPTQELALADLQGVGLIGPIPQGDGLHNWSRGDFGNVLT